MGKPILFLPLFLITLSHAALNTFRVVIDPGHGGGDWGAVYTSGFTQYTEKEITLLLSQEIAQQLRIRGYDVILTRTTDVEVPLSVRTALANKLHADVFLSVHLNSTDRPDTQAEGFETYILNSTTDETSKKLARLENQMINSKDRTETNLDVALILKDLRLDANLSESKKLACAIQESISKPGKPCKNRGIKQALFHVLLGADMPSVLFEAGFLTSRKDRNYLLSSEGKRSVGVAIAGAMERFSAKKNHSKIDLSLNRCKVY